MPATKESGLKHWPLNRTGSSAEIRVYSDIGFWFTAQMFLDQLDSLAGVDVIDLRINSYGGVASEAVAMYNALARHPAKKRVWIDAAAYSAASILSLAASPGELRIAFNARTMMHNAWNFGEGDKREFRKQADILEQLDGIIATTYAKRMSKHSKEQILALMNEETWFDAEGAVAAGLADETFDAGEIELPEDEMNLVREFKHMPQDLAERIQARSSVRRQLNTEPAALPSSVDVAARWAAVRNRNAV